MPAGKVSKNRPCLSTPCGVVATVVSPLLEPDLPLVPAGAGGGSGGGGLLGAVVDVYPPGGCRGGGRGQAAVVTLLPVPHPHQVTDQGRGGG